MYEYVYAKMEMESLEMASYLIELIFIPKSENFIAITKMVVHNHSSTRVSDTFF